MPLLGWPFDNAAFRAAGRDKTTGAGGAMEKPTGQKTGAAFAYVTTLFFAWGFVTSTLNPLVPAVRSIFTSANDR